MPNKLEQLIEEFEKVLDEDETPLNFGYSINMCEYGCRYHLQKDLLPQFIRHVYASACEEVARKIPAIEDKKTDTSETRAFLSALKSAREIALDEANNAKK